MDIDTIKFLAYMLYIHQTDAENVYMEEFEEIQENEEYLDLLHDEYRALEEKFGVREYE